MTINPSNLKSALHTPPALTQTRSNVPANLSSTSGFRSAEAYVRPSPIATAGDVTSYGFDLKSVTFSFSLVAPAPTNEEVPTEIFLPEFHFPPGKTVVDVTGGRWRIDLVDVDGEGMQVMKWWHGAGEQSMTIKGVKRKPGALEEEVEGDEGYVETMTRTVQNCSVM